MGDAYPELRAEEQRIREVIRTEEERFGETLEQGLALLEEATAKLKRENRQVLSGTSLSVFTILLGFRLI